MGELVTPRAGRAAPAVLVANRGEIAVRIIRTLRGLGTRSVAVYSDADAGARHVRDADVALRVPGYLDADAVIGAALASGATMVHPGYGFLAENAAFARACADAGLVFVGPPPGAIEAMGDKIQAKRTVADAGVPLLPGFAESPGRPMTDAELVAAAARVGYPLLVKPSAGGGGKGMRLVRGEGELAAAAASARREALAAFGDATLLVERFVERPRHIEVQVLADAHGNVVHLGERECSLQRRHQKIVEEAPSPLLTPAGRAAMGEAAVAAAKACGYVGAGTVEFIVGGADTPPSPGGAPGEGEDPAPHPRSDHGAAGPRTGGSAPVDGAGPGYFFLEMNTRLQVEHPVTEAVTTIGGVRGIDLVEAQLRVARGEPLPFSQADIGLAGHAVECRVYAEDPARGFLPTGGRVLLLDEPDGPEARVDSGLTEGAPVTSDYDPMLAKVIVWGADRAEALRRADAALARYTLLGCGVNTAFLRALLASPEVAAGDLSTDLTERLRPGLVDGVGVVPDTVLAAAALDRQLGLEPGGPVVDRFDVPDGWRIGDHAWTTWRLHAPGRDGGAVAVRVRAHDRAARRFQVRVGEGGAVEATAERSADGRSLVVGHGGRTVRYARAATDGELWLGLDGAAWALREEALLAPLRASAVGTDGTVRSPMPGTVLAVSVEQGAAVRAGDAVAVVEAMKMEHSVTAPVDGTVTALRARPGQSVAMDAVLAVITPAEAGAASTTAEEQS